MLLDFSMLVNKWNLKIKGVIQCGAHFAEEFSEYKKHDVSPMVFIEPCRKAYYELYERLSKESGVYLFRYACGNYVGTATMYTGDETVNKGMSNSLLKPDLHLQLHKEVEFTDTEEVSVEKLDNLIATLYGWTQGTFNLLVMDCQGYEGEVLRGATETLKSIDYVYTEINFASVYENCTQAEELDELLHEFERVETGVKVGGMWSDCLYIRKTLLK